jgi:hypothetical protein
MKPDVSEERTTIFRAEEKLSPSFLLFLLVSSLVYHSTLKMEARTSPESWGGFSLSLSPQGYMVTVFIRRWQI